MMAGSTPSVPVGLFLLQQTFGNSLRYWTHGYGLRTFVDQFRVQKRDTLRDAQVTLRFTLTCLSGLHLLLGAVPVYTYWSKFLLCTLLKYTPSMRFTQPILTNTLTVFLLQATHGIFGWAIILDVPTVPLWVLFTSSNRNSKAFFPSGCSHSSPYTSCNALRPSHFRLS